MHSIYLVLHIQDFLTFKSPLIGIMKKKRFNGSNMYLCIVSENISAPSTRPSAFCWTHQNRKTMFFNMTQNWFTSGSIIWSPILFRELQYWRLFGMFTSWSGKINKWIVADWNFCFSVWVNNWLSQVHHYYLSHFLGWALLYQVWTTNHCCGCISLNPQSSVSEFYASCVQSASCFSFHAFSPREPYHRIRELF